MNDTLAFTTSRGRTLAYSVRGAGPLVVMLPGGPGIHPSAYYADAVLPGFQQVVLFPRGTGRSDPPAGPDGYRLAGYVEDLEELRLHLDIARLTLHGSSHGGSIALAYASAHPDRVERMVVAGGPARMDALFVAALADARERFAAGAPNGAKRLSASDEAGQRMRTAETDTARRDATRVMIDTYIAHQTDRTARFLDRLADAPANPAAIGPMVAELMGGLDLLAGAAAITAPTLVLSGELDVRVPTEHMRVIADSLPHAEFVRLPETGHLVHAEAPDVWAATVTAFLRRP